jgi:hypothetical protein
LNIKIREVRRDDRLAVLQKKVDLDGCSFLTPTRSIKSQMAFGEIKREERSVNEITRRVDDGFIRSLESGGADRLARESRARFLSGKLNLVIYNLSLDQFPRSDMIRNLAQHLYASSDKTIFLPTIKSSLLKEDSSTGPKPKLKLSEIMVLKYANMIKEFIDDIEAVGNGKVFVGTIPLLPIKFARYLIQLYAAKGISFFAIDANNSDFLYHEAEVRMILSEINQSVPLSEALIYACNLGLPRYGGSSVSANDFMSIFEYVDVMGDTFKTRGMKTEPGLPPIPPVLKQFFRDDYAYHILESSAYTPVRLKQENQDEQLREAHKVRDFLGEESLKPYLQTKAAVTKPILDKLEFIASNVKVK